MRKISVLIAGQHSTSISLESEFLTELKKIADERDLSLNQLITEVDSMRTGENLSSAHRVYILQYYKNKLLTPE